MKVFLDSNVLVSALATRGLCTELFEVVLQDHELLLSVPLVEELNRVLGEKLRLSSSITEQYLALLQSQATLITADHSYPSLPDLDDEPIVASALAGEAEVFVTGDKALLELQSISGLRVISPREFWEILSAR